MLILFNYKDIRNAKTAYIQAGSEKTMASDDRNDTEN